MAELSTLARPYAKAAFNAALETGDLDAWSTALATLGAIIGTDEVHQFIGNPSITASEKANTLAAIADGDCNEGAKNLLDVLAENNRFPLLEVISEQFELLKAEHEKSARVLVKSAFSLSDAQQKTLSDKLAKKFDREVTLTVEIDPALIGGVIIKAGDLVIDDSVRGKLSKLADAMNS